MKKFATTILCAALSSIAAPTLTAAPVSEFSDMYKQLAIMEKIVKSATAHEGNTKAVRINGVESTYLKGQGVLFTINSSSRGSHWGNYSFNFALPEVPPIPPVAPLAPKAALATIDEDDLVDAELEQQVANALESAAVGYERAMDAVFEDRESFREVREQRRNTAYELREIERELRDHEFQLRRADKESRKELEAAVKSLEQQKQKLTDVAKSIEKQVQEVRKEQLAKRAEREKERIAYYKSLTNSLAETFCLYGNGLKAVPKSENVNLIIKSGGAKQGNRYKDRVIVFSKQDITACAGDRLTTAQLLEKSKSYEF